MFNLRTHPFAVDAFFDHSLVLTYALPVSTLQPMIPDCLAPDSWNQKWVNILPQDCVCSGC